MKTLSTPSAYTDGYAKARLYNQEKADNYIRNTTIGDPELDPVMEELASLPPPDLHRFIKAGIDQETKVLRTAPQVMRDFFDKVDNETPPGTTTRHSDPVYAVST